MRNLIIFGPPGAGKGTQAKMIAKEFNLYHLSSGEILRETAKEESLQKEIDTFLAAGKLVPDELIIKLIETDLKEHLTNGGIIFDGYPRTLNQAKSLDTLFIKQNVELSRIINLDLEEEIAISRIMSRAENSQRSDDKLAIIQERFKVYHASTEPLINYYQESGRLINIDARPDIETINKNINTYIHSLKF